MTLAQRSVRSAGYTIASSGFQAGVQFVRSIVLARLLLPEVFGVYAYAASLVMLTHALPGFGMGSALVHRAHQSEGETARRVHFTLTFIFNILWVALLGLIAPWFITPQHRWVLWAILLSRAGQHLTNTGRVLLTRKVAFRRVAVIDTTTALSTTIAAIYLAWRGAGLWSLVSTDIIAALIALAGFYLIRPVWKPRFGWERETAAYLLDFGRRTTAGIIILQMLDRVDDLWAGAFLGDAALGFYSRAYTFATYPRKLFASPINQVVSGTYAALKGKPKRLSQAFFRANAFLIRSGFLLAGLLFLLVPEFVHFVIGDKWQPMITPFRLMLVYTLLDPIKVSTGNIFIAVGRPEILTRARFWQLGVMLAGLFTLGPLWGIEGVALAVDLMLVFGIALLFREARPYVRFSARRLFGAPLLGLVLGLGLAKLTYELGSDAALLTQAAWKSVAFLAGYVISLGLIERTQWRSMLMTASSLMKLNSRVPRPPRTP